MDFSAREDIALNITNRCNFTCAHCLREQASADDLDPALLDAALPEAKRLGFRFCAITGGEPILHPRFEELLAVIARHDLRFNFVTNGWLYERYLPLIDRFRANLDNVGVSLDGPWAATHDGLRRAGSFDRATEAVQAFLAQGLPVTSNFLVTRRNRHELAEHVAFARDLGLYEVWLAGLIPTPGTPPDYYLSDEETTAVADEALALSRALGFPVKFSSCFKPVPGLFFCAAAVVPQPTINPLGEMVFCCNTVGRGAVAGSLREHSFGVLYGRCLELGQRVLARRLQELVAGQEVRCGNNCAYCHLALGGEVIGHFGCAPEPERSAGPTERQAADPALAQARGSTAAAHDRRDPA